MMKKLSIRITIFLSVTLCVFFYCVSVRSAQAAQANPPQGMVNCSKQVSKQNADGSYDIRLSLNGETGQQQIKPKINVCFVIDKSGSMNQAFYYDPYSGMSYSRWNACVDSLSLLVDSLQQNTDIDSSVSVVAFSGQGSLTPTNPIWAGSAQIVTDWVKPNSDNIYGKLENVYVDGGTNWQSGIMVAQNLFKQLSPDRSGSDARNVLIFLSDGNPTYFFAPNDGYYQLEPGYPAQYCRKGACIGYGNAYDERGLRYAINQLKDGYPVTGKPFFVNDFYVIGVGDSYAEFSHLSDLMSAVPSNVQKAYYEATSEDALVQHFDDITARIVSTFVSHVTLTDTMSEFVSITPNKTGDNTYNTWLEIRNKSNNNLLYESEAKPGQTTFSLPGTQEKAQLVVTNVDGKQQVTVKFPSHYTLNPTFSYTLVSNVRFNEKAFEQYNKLNNGKDPVKLMTNDNNNTTVTYHSGLPDDDPSKPGFYSTDNISVDPVPVRNFVVKKIVSLKGSNTDKETFYNKLKEGNPQFIFKVILPESKLNKTITYDLSPKLFETEFFKKSVDATTGDLVFEFSDFALFNLPNNVDLGKDGAEVFLKEDEKSFGVVGYRLNSSITPNVTNPGSSYVIKDSSPSLIATFNNSYKKIDYYPVLISKKVEGNGNAVLDKDRKYQLKLIVNSYDTQLFTTPESFKAYVKEINPSLAQNMSFIFGQSSADSPLNVEISLKQNQSVTLNLPLSCSCTLAEDAVPEGFEIPKYIIDQNIETVGKAEFDVSNRVEIQVINAQYIAAPTRVTRENMPFVLLGIGGVLTLGMTTFWTYKRIKNH